MWNTCSIGRRWKSREGWSRPVLTGERGTLSNPCGLGLVLWWFFSLDGREHCFLWSRDERSKRFACVRCPVPGPPRSESWLVPFAGRSPGGLAVVFGFAVVMAQVRRPVPFRTRKLRPGRGDGTALERVWESSTPPHSTSEDPPVESHGGIPGGSSFFIRTGFPSGVTPREPHFLFFLFLLCRPAGRRPWVIGQNVCLVVWG